MKVVVYEANEVTDEERTQIAAVVDQQVKPKRKATRDEMKEFLWTEGRAWRAALEMQWGLLPGATPPVAQEDLTDVDVDLLGDASDLLGDTDPDLEDLL